MDLDFLLRSVSICKFCTSDIVGCFHVFTLDNLVLYQHKAREFTEEKVWKGESIHSS